MSTDVLGLFVAGSVFVLFAIRNALFLKPERQHARERAKRTQTG
jgi:hypothetical protein